LIPLWGVGTVNQVLPSSVPLCGIRVTSRGTERSRSISNRKALRARSRQSTTSPLSDSEAAGSRSHYLSCPLLLEYQVQPENWPNIFERIRAEVVWNERQNFRTVREKLDKFSTFRGWVEGRRNGTMSTGKARAREPPIEAPPSPRVLLLDGNGQRV
jgi:hypothetical protein